MRGGDSSKAVYRRWGKRLLDVTVAALGLLLVSPLIVLIALLSRLFLGRGTLFRQLRPGRDGKPFEICKFRTMTDERGSDGAVLSDGLRVTPFGRFLRAASLDELPTLWMVLRGDMSLVGPRPLLMEYLPLYSDRQARRHEVRPGISGWAQVNGRNTLTWEQKFEMDVWYVENLSFGLDLRILWRTLAAVVRREGISAPGEATMPAFTGEAKAGPDVSRSVRRASE